jgi:hypothetical protein
MQYSTACGRTLPLWCRLEGARANNLEGVQANNLEGAQANTTV